MQASVKKNISVIPAKPAYDRSIRPQMRTLRVAAYCRVSTLMEQQESSYEAQVQYYTCLLYTSQYRYFSCSAQKEKHRGESAMTTCRRSEGLSIR